VNQVNAEEEEEEEEKDDCQPQTRVSSLKTLIADAAVCCLGNMRLFSLKTDARQYHERSLEVYLPASMVEFSQN
jgi:hypothetical protein